MLLKIKIYKLFNHLTSIKVVYSIEQFNLIIEIQFQKQFIQKV